MMGMPLLCLLAELRWLLGRVELVRNGTGSGAVWREAGWCAYIE